MLNTISHQFLQSLQPLQTVPTVKLPAAPRTCHHSNFVVSYNTRRSLLVWLPTQRLHISVVLLVALSRNQLENIPPIFPPYHHPPAQECEVVLLLGPRHTLECHACNMCLKLFLELPLELLSEHLSLLFAFTNTSQFFLHFCRGGLG